MKKKWGESRLFALYAANKCENMTVCLVAEFEV